MRRVWRAGQRFILDADPSSVARMKMVGAGQEPIPLDPNEKRQDAVEGCNKWFVF